MSSSSNLDPPPDIIIEAGFSSIDVEGVFREETLRKGSEIRTHVREIRERRSAGQVTITGMCIPQTKLRDKPHSLWIEIDPQTRKWIDGHCRCKAGEGTSTIGKCKHIAALVLEINSERTEGCTDTPQRWKQTTVSNQLCTLYPKGKCIEELYLGTYTPQMPERPNEDTLMDLATKLASFGLTNSSLFKTLTVDTTDVPMDVAVEQVPVDPEIERMFTEDEEEFIGQKPSTLEVESDPDGDDDEFNFDPDEFDFEPDAEQEGEPSDEDDELSQAVAASASRFYHEKVVVTNDALIDIFQKTMGQGTGTGKTEWYAQRKTRISASIAHKIFRGGTKEIRHRHKFGTRRGHPNMEYGCMMEETARRKYEEVKGVRALKCGLIISKRYNWLCGSADAIAVDQNGSRILVEIKCPSSNKNSAINVKYLKNGKLKRRHEYFAQVQLLMYLAKCQLAHLFIYSDADYKIVEVEMDKDYL